MKTIKKPQTLKEDKSYKDLVKGTPKLLYLLIIKIILTHIDYIFYFRKEWIKGLNVLSVRPVKILLSFSFTIV